MPQVSRPLLIALVAVVGFAGLWMTVLKKHPSSGATPSSAPKAPGMTGLGHAIDRAHGAVAASNASAAQSESSAAAVGQDTATPAPAKPAPAPAKVAAKPAPAPNVIKPPVGTTTVLLFAGAGADDAAARQVVRSISMRHVRKVIASLADVSRYQPLLGSTHVDGAPSIFVIGPDSRAQQIVGLPDAGQVEAAVAAVR